MATSGPVAESPIECALRLANDAVEKGLIGGYAVAGAFAFIYYEEPFEAKGLDLMMKVSLTQGGLVDVAPNPSPWTSTSGTCTRPSRSGGGAMPRSRSKRRSRSSWNCRKPHA